MARTRIAPLLLFFLLLSAAQAQPPQPDWHSIEDGLQGYGAHSDQERVREEAMHKFVRFHWDIVVNLAQAR